MIALLAGYGLYFILSSRDESFKGEREYRISNIHLEKKNIARALVHIDRGLEENPDFPPMHMTRGIILMLEGKYIESKNSFDKAISGRNDFAEAYANRGILNDRLEKYNEAAKDYRDALRYNPSLAEGPGWLWRFARNIHEKQPTIYDRLNYLEKELKKPEKDRVLKYDPFDKKQNMYQPGKIL